MKERFILSLASLAALVLCGCATTPQSPYRDPGELRGRTTDFTTYDMQQCANFLMDSLLKDKQLNAKIKKKKPSLAIKIKNETHQLNVTDMLRRSMLNAIQTRLRNSDKFEIADRDAEQEIISDTLSEMDSLLTQEGSTASFGAAKGVDYLLLIVLEEFREGDGRQHDMYYAMTAKLINKRTNRIVWSGRKELRKVSTRPLVGR